MQFTLYRAAILLPFDIIVPLRRKTMSFPSILYSGGFVKEYIAKVV